MGQVTVMSEVHRWVLQHQVLRQVLSPYKEVHWCLQRLEIKRKLYKWPQSRKLAPDDTVESGSPFYIYINFLEQ